MCNRNAWFIVCRNKDTYASGTSLSCPIVAGIAALIQSTHPELTSFEVRDAIRNTARRAGNPDNDYGWGIVNGLSAALYHGPIISNFPEKKKWRKSK